MAEPGGKGNDEFVGWATFLALFLVVIGAFALSVTRAVNDLGRWPIAAGNAIGYAVFFGLLLVVILVVRNDT